ncbi:hypothetical protein WS69_05885 [Burkholderia sp. BDU5]|nr:hypothetical protein WS69_05885 [Burkholderia sp. BDU5]
MHAASQAIRVPSRPRRGQHPDIPDMVGLLIDDGDRPCNICNAGVRIAGEASASNSRVTRAREMKTGYRPDAEHRALHAPAPRRSRRQAGNELAPSKHATCAKPLTHRTDDLVVRHSLARAAIEKTHSSIAARRTSHSNDDASRID